MRVIKFTRKCRSLPIKGLVYHERRNTEDLFAKLKKILRAKRGSLSPCPKTQKKGRKKRKKRKKRRRRKKTQKAWSLF